METDYGSGRHQRDVCSLKDGALSGVAHLTSITCDAQAYTNLFEVDLVERLVRSKRIAD